MKMGSDLHILHSAFGIDLVGSISQRDVFYGDGASGVRDMHGNAARVAESEAGAE